MTQERITAILQRWHAALLDCDSRLDELAAVVGPVVDSPLAGAVYRVMGAYTKAVADQIGWCEETLEAWWTEHQFGARPLKIGFVGEPMRSIATIEDLAAFVAEDLARATHG